MQKMFKTLSTLLFARKLKRRVQNMKVALLFNFSAGSSRDSLLFLIFVVIISVTRWRLDVY